MAAGIKIDGLDEAVRKMNKLGASVAYDRIMPVLMKGAKTVRDVIYRYAPVRTGALKAGLAAKASKRTARAVAYAVVDMKVVAARDKRGPKTPRYPYILEHGIRATSQSKGGRRRYTLKPHRYFAKGVQLAKPVVKAQIEHDVQALVERSVT